MATKKLILQGFTPLTHQEAIRHVLSCPKLERAIASVAFITDNGVALLGPELKKVAGKATVFAGIRNGITSRQGLETLLSMGTRLYVVDTGARSVLFHPKLFYARGKDTARLVIGSANLTLGGLNNNIEFGVSIEMALNDPADFELAASIDAQFDSLPATYPKNVLLVGTKQLLREFEESGLLLDEAAAIAPTPSSSAKTPSKDLVPKIVLKVPRQFPSIKKAKASKSPAKVKATSPSPVSVTWELVWQSKALTERDLNVPKGSNTNATGSVNLDKGLLGAEIDHRHYFRDSVFAQLAWASSGKPSVEESVASFQLVIKGVEYGEFDLRVAHTISTTSRSYKQRNAMTRLSWGPMKPFVALDSLIGRTMSLYRSAERPTEFMIEID